jgi:hypothetical protein
MQMTAETRKQNEILDEIHSGLDGMLANARVSDGWLAMHTVTGSVLCGVWCGVVWCGVVWCGVVCVLSSGAHILTHCLTRCDCTVCELCR